MGKEERLSAEEEMDLRLFSFNMASIYKTTLVFSFFFFSIGLYFSTRTLVAGYENYEKRIPGFLEARAVKGYTGRVTFHEVTLSLDKSHPLYELEQRPWPWISYDFGSTQANYCFRMPYPKYRILPSILRLFEFIAEFQLFTRMAVLSAICIRLFLTTASVNYMYHLLNGSKFASVMRLSLPLLDVSWMTAAVLVLCLHQDQDEKIKWFMHYHLLAFAIFFLLYSCGYLLFSAVALRNSRLPQVHLLCVLLFAASFSYMKDDYLFFLQKGNKPCYPHVRDTTALAEYCAVAAVLIFVLSQFAELQNIVGFVSISRKEFEESITESPSYSPAFAELLRKEEESSMKKKKNGDRV